MKKRIIIFLLILIIFISSCGSPEDNNSNTKNPAGDSHEQQTKDDIITTDEIAPDLPERDFNEAKINFLVRGGDANEWDALDIYTEGETGDAVNDIIFQRNCLVESKYNVIITETPVKVGSAYSTVSKLVKSGDNSYHAVIANAEESFSMSTNNLLLDLNAIPNIDLKNPWWDIALNKDLTLRNRQFCAANATNLMSYEATWIAMFNKKMLTDSGYDPANIYNMVKEGKWTLASYLELTKDYIMDLNNDGKMDDKDQYGTSGQSTLATGFYIGADLRFIEKDDNDGLIFKEFDDRTANLLDMITEICNNKTAFNSHDTSMNKQHSSNPEYSRVLLAENRTLFFTETLLCVRILREMAEAFGVVPMPKYDETQENYTSMVHHWATSLNSVPNICPDLEMTGIILEEMAYQSKQKVLPVYFEKAINGKYLRDEESIEMIDYIMQNRVIDLGVASNYGNISGGISDLIYKGKTDFASLYEKSGNSVKKEIDKIMNNLEQ